MAKKYLNRNSLSSRPFIFGTFILTATGFISRIIGFFYRIYLSRLFGEEGMGIYQLLSPVLSLSFSLCAAAYQTTISKFVAQYTSRKNTGFGPLLAGLGFSLPLSLICLFFLLRYGEWISTHLLLESRCESMLYILAFSIPFSSIHACINGYFYGIKKTGPPALSQLAEQVTRVGFVYLITSYMTLSGKTPSIDVAVFGLAVGELVSMCVCLFAIFRVWHQSTASECVEEKVPPFQMAFPILTMALPLTLNRIVVNLLQSVESVSIPSRLRMYGYDQHTALSVYGVLTGMAMPMIFFPNAITGSISVLLLPFISEKDALGNFGAVKETTKKTILFCSGMGILCMIGFLIFGDFIGSYFFDSALAGHFIRTLSFLCPFMYLDMTLSSVLQGLGKAGTVFVLNVCALCIRLCFVFFLIPYFGISSYLFGMLTSQVLLSLLYLIYLYFFLGKKSQK